MSMPGDRYRIQVRYVGESVWVYSTVHMELFPAEWSARLVRELNEVAQGVVYRAVLVAGGVDESALLVNAMESTEMPLNYQIQGRRRGLTDEGAWFDMAGESLVPSDQVARRVAYCNESAPEYVFRAVLVAGGVGDSVAPVAGDEVGLQVVSLTVAQIAMLRMWLPLQIECLDAAVTDSKRWEIWRAQADAARSLLQKIS